MHSRILAPALALCVVLSLIPAAAADTVVLKDGTSVEGKVLAETDTEIIVEVQVSSSITDRKAFPKAEVEEVRKTSPDDLAWSALKDFALPANSLEAGDYDTLAAQFDGFLAEHPASPHAAAAKELLASVRAEQERVLAGDVKLDGAWISAEEVLRRGSEINAEKLLARMKSLAAGGDLPGALNEYKLIEKNHKNEAAYPEAIELTRQIISALQAELARRKADLERHNAEFEQGVALAREHLRQGIRDAAAAQQAEYDAILARAKQAGLEFPPLIPRSSNSIKELENAVKREAGRLARLDTSKLRESIALVNRAREAVAAGRFDEVEPLLEQAKQLWNQNAAIARVQAEAGAGQAEAAAEAAAAEAARIAAEAEREAAEAAAKKAEREAAEATDQTGAKPKAKPATGSSADKPFYLTVPGAIGIVAAVLVVLALVSLASKLSAARKKNAE